MTILALDTATEILSVSLLASAGSYAVVEDAGLRHSERLLKVVEEVLSRASVTPSELDLIVVSLGPGSFTGLRIGLATAKGLAAAVGAEIVQVDNFAVYGALYAAFDTAVLPVIDAKKKRFYAAAYRGGREIFPASDLSIEEIVERTEELEEIVVTGPHADIFLDRMSQATGRHRFALDPDYRKGMATVMVGVGRRTFDEQGPSPLDCTPRYLRLSDAELSLRKSSGSGHS